MHATLARRGASAGRMERFNAWRSSRAFELFSTRTLLALTAISCALTIAMGVQLQLSGEVGRLRPARPGEAVANFFSPRREDGKPKFSGDDGSG